MKNQFSTTRKLTISGIVIAIYVAVMFMTQGFAFGAIQVRIATSMYALPYIYPFLILPLGVANFLSNFLGGLGIYDIVGGTIAGIVTSGFVYLIKKHNMPKFLIVPIIVLGPGLLVPIWLSPILGVPYLALAFSLCIGQITPALAGYALIEIWARRVENR